MELAIKNKISWLLYPFTMVSSVVLFYLFKDTDNNFIASTYISLLFSSVVIFFFEYYMPFNMEWKPGKKDWINDAIYFVFIQSLLSKALVWLTVVFLMAFLANNNLILTTIWPQNLPIAVQVILVILISDFLRYWLHRLSHTIPFLWRFHAVHHSVDKLYWLNTSRFHPIEKALQFSLDVLPFMLIGVSQEVIALHFVLYAVNGSFQHCNIIIKYGWLNYVVSSGDLHRWHHSREIDESNNNYGNNVIIWDLIFGSFFLPKDRVVEELGLKNKEYPSDFLNQMKTPFIPKIDKIAMPVPSIKDMWINFLLALKMSIVKGFYLKPLIRKTNNPRETQLELLKSIVAVNCMTHYGRLHNFLKINTYEDYKRMVPIVNYENLRPFIEEQDTDQTAALTAEMPFMYNQTSGTTGLPKYIPVLKSSMKSFKKTQQIYSLIQYKYAPLGYRGKILGIASPAIEGYLETGTPYGSASGHLLKTMPKSARSKYAVPYEVFEIKDYALKYYVIARLSIEQPDVTYMASANPSTFHKLLDVINKNIDSIVSDIRTGKCKGIENVSPSVALAIKNRLKPNAKRAADLENLKNEKSEITFTDVWPHFNILSAWLGGSCGISLASILPKFPEEVNVIEIGYVSSEFRGTITIDPSTNAGIPTLHENFFEFVEQQDFENDILNFKLLDELELNKMYYVFVTTTTGLYRYDMNDILKVDGFFNQTPTLKFMQKGKGATNITGEKLYEVQLIEAVKAIEHICNVKIDFYQLIANEEGSHYEFYFEPKTKIEVSSDHIIELLDEHLQKLNIEYATKRQSDRLTKIIGHALREGTHDHYKIHCLNKGQKEGQFKILLLQYKKNTDFDYLAHAH